MSQAQDYVIYDSNIRLIKSSGGKFDFSTQLLRSAGNTAAVTIGTTDVGSLTADQRAHTAMKASLDIQRATAAEALLLYLSLGEGLPKVSYSVAAVAYAPAGRDWNDGDGVKVWDVEVSDVRVEPEAIRLAQQAKQEGPETALPIPVISRKDYVPATPAGTRRDNSLDTQLFGLLSDIVTEDQKEHSYTVKKAKQLISQGANVNARDHGQTPLLRAAQNGHLQVMKVLLDHEVDVNAQDEDDGRTALMIAAGLSDPAMVRLLLERGAKVNIKDKDGFTAWTGSEMIGGSNGPAYIETRRLLRRAGAK